MKAAIFPRNTSRKNRETSPRLFLRPEDGEDFDILCELVEQYDVAGFGLGKNKFLHVELELKEKDENPVN